MKALSKSSMFVVVVMAVESTHMQMAPLLLIAHTHFQYH